MLCTAVGCMTSADTASKPAHVQEAERESAASAAAPTGSAAPRARTLAETAFTAVSFIRVAPDGLVYIDDPSRQVLYRFDSEGRLLDERHTWFDEEKNLMLPRDIAFDHARLMLMLSEHKHAVLKLDTDGSVLLSFGGQGSAEGQFLYPNALAVDSRDNIYVADANNLRIQVFSPDGNFIHAVSGDTLPGKPYFRPTAIRLDRDDNLLVLASDRMYRFSPDGTLLSQWNAGGTGPGRTGSVTDFCIGTDGTLFVADSLNHKITKLGPDGAILEPYGTFGDDPGCYKRPSSVALGSGGLLYVGDPGNGRVQTIDPAVSFTAKPEPITDYPADWMASFGDPASADGALPSPVYITGDASGRLYVTGAAHRVMIYDRNGKYLSSVGSASRSGNTKPGLFDDPRQTAVDSKGTLFVADNGNNRIQKFDANGTFLGLIKRPEAVAGNTGRISALALDRDDNLYAVDLVAGVIVKFDPTGKLAAHWPMYYKDLTRYGAGGSQTAWNIAVDPDGNLLVCDRTNQSIVRYDPSGRFLQRLRTPEGTRVPMKSPGGIAFDSDGTMYVTDSFQNRIFVFAPDGTYRTSWGYFGTDKGKFDRPGGIYIDASDTLYVCDSGNHRIQTFRLK